MPVLLSAGGNRELRRSPRTVSLRRSPVGGPGRRGGEDNLSRFTGKRLIASVVTLGLVLAISGVIAERNLPGLARRILIGELEQRFQSTIEIGAIDVRGLIPVRIQARDIILRYHGRTDVPPLMRIQQLTGSAYPHDLWRRKWRVTSIHLQGLQIIIAPDGDNATAPYVVSQAQPKFRLPALEFVEVIADDALLEICPRQKEGKPHSFKIHHLLLKSVTRSQPAYFHARLTNEVPVGEIDSEGKFGPWNADQPELTPVSARFDFVNANLGQFRGLSGTLSSSGRYRGVLERLDVEGTALVPDFKLSIAGQPVALITRYLAVVDGTNGNTYLQDVEAHFLHSQLKVRGEIVEPPGRSPRRIVLTVASKDARVEDLLQLVTNETAVPLSGAVSLQTHFELPSGGGDIVDRLLLRGQFEISQADFESPETRRRIDNLSRRAQGKPGDPEISGVLAEIRGNLVVRGGETYFPKFEFAIPGASVSLKGSYGLHNGAIDFHGTLRLSSKISQTTMGVKSALLRVLNPFFRDASGGTVLPIKINGTRSNLSFGLDLHKHGKIPLALRRTAEPK